MKNLILAIATSTVLLTACNNSPKVEETSTEVQSPNENANALFSCPMHPEVIGKKGENCSKCGMELTVPVETMDNMDHNDSSKIEMP